MDLMGFLMNLAAHSIAQAPLKNANMLDIIAFLLEDDNCTKGAQSVKAAFITAFLVGREEKKEDDMLPLSVGSDTMVRLMLNTLRHVLDGVNGEDHLYVSDFPLMTIIKSFLYMSTSDSHKNILASGPLLGMLMEPLSAFVNKTPLNATTDSFVTNVGLVGMVIETLLQLSFVHDDTDELQEKFMDTTSGVKDMMECLVSNTELGEDAIKHAKLLLSRVRPRDNAAVHEMSKKKLTHIFVSYCWAAPAHPEHVTEFTRRLRNRGYEVWQDKVECGVTVLHLHDYTALILCAAGWV